MFEPRFSWDEVTRPAAPVASAAFVACPVSMFPAMSADAVAVCHQLHAQAVAAAQPKPRRRRVAGGEAFFWN